jgi:hypothetical protein
LNSRPAAGEAGAARVPESNGRPGSPAMPRAGHADAAADLTIVLLLATAAAGWTGLVAAQLDRFGLVPVVVAGGVAGLGGWWALRPRTGSPAAGSGTWARRLDGPLVFLLAAALYLPGYDTALYGSDATVYYGMGVHVARAGSLVVDEPVLAQLSPALAAFAFPPMVRGPDSPMARSRAGLVSEGRPGRSYSTFSQLSSIWIAIGDAIAGLPGARAVVPLLAAAGVMAFFLVVRRTSGLGVALVAAVLLATTQPQLVFARVPMGECIAQWFLWGAVLAWDRFRETGARAAAIAAGVGIGLTGLVRPEYVVFVPLTLLLLRLLRGASEPVPAVAAAIAVGCFVHAAALVLVVVPSHYRHEFRAALAASGLQTGDAAGVLAVAATGALAAGVAVAASALELPRVLPGARATLAAFFVLWAVAYAAMEPSPSFGRGIPWLPYEAAWPVLVLGAVGLPLLIARWGAWAATRVALTLGLVVGAHLLYDLHASPMPVWAGRRLLAAFLPVVCAAAATAIGALARRRLAAGVVVGALTIVSAFWQSGALLRGSYLDGASDAVARIAALVPPEALVFVDSGLMPAEIDASLLLLHGRHAIQAGGMMTGIESRLFLFDVHLPGVPIYLIRSGTLPPPEARTSDRLRFEEAGEVRTRLRLFGDDEPGSPFSVRVYRVVSARNA